MIVSVTAPGYLLDGVFARSERDVIEEVLRPNTKGGKDLWTVMKRGKNFRATSQNGGDKFDATSASELAQKIHHHFCPDREYDPVPF